MTMVIFVPPQDLYHRTKAACLAIGVGVVVGHFLSCMRMSYRIVQLALLKLRLLCGSDKVQIITLRQAKVVVRVTEDCENCKWNSLCLDLEVMIWAEIVIIAV